MSIIYNTSGGSRSFEKRTCLSDLEMISVHFPTLIQCQWFNDDRPPLHLHKLLMSNTCARVELQFPIIITVSSSVSGLMMDCVQRQPLQNRNVECHLCCQKVQFLVVCLGVNSRGSRTCLSRVCDVIYLFKKIIKATFKTTALTLLGRWFLQLLFVHLKRGNVYAQ